jgi:prepilin peptidase CpaA
MPLEWTYAWAICVTGVVLIIASVTDVRTGKIYNWLTYPAVAVGLIGHTLLGGLTGEGSAALGLTGSLLGLAVGFGPLLLAWFAGGINGGDAKLMGVLGALTGWAFTLSAMFYGFAVAAVMSLIVMVRRRVLLRTLKRVGRFLYLSFSPNRPADPATPESPKIPFGFALCIGSAIACVEFLLRGREAFGWPLGG